MAKLTPSPLIRSIRSAFGGVIAGVSPGSSFGFQGHVNDTSTGQSEFRNRNFSAQQGRFIGQDPIRFASGQTNHYALANNHPHMGTDPSGLQEEINFDRLTRDQFTSAISGFTQKDSAGRMTGYYVPMTLSNGERYGAVFKTWSKSSLRGRVTRHYYSLAGIVPGNYDPKTAIELLVTDQRLLASANATAGALEFALHVVPLGAAADYTAQGDSINAVTSIAGDAASLFTFGAGKVFTVGRASMRISSKAGRVGAGIEAAVGIYRTGEGVYLISQGEGGTGQIAEGLLRLVGASVSMLPAPNGGLFSEVSREAMDAGRFAKIKAAFTRNSGVIDQSADAQGYLRYRQAEGVTFDAKTVLLPERSSTSSVFEEMIHTTQHRTGRFSRAIDQYGNARAINAIEIEAAERLIRNRKAWGIPNSETRQTIQRLRLQGESFGQ